MGMDGKMGWASGAIVEIFSLGFELKGAIKTDHEKAFNFNNLLMILIGLVEY